MKRAIQLNGHSVYFTASLKDVGKKIDLAHYSSLIILCDENTRALCLPELLSSVPLLKYASVLEIPSGEAYKNIDTCEKIWKELFRLNIDRKALLINLGGGVVTDMGGFIAATYKRGFDFVNIPTTLLAQVDATIGGKTGVDFNGIKNGIGLFTFPKAVFIHTPFLKTLDDAQLLSGFAEMLKHALITSEAQWKKISAIKPLAKNDWDSLVYDSMHIKKNIVEQDPYETGVRRVLNFGHTIGHALEGYSLQQSEPILHGHAVALGMISELWLSAQKTGFPKKDVQKITGTLLNLYRSYYNIGRNMKELLRLARNDKKNSGGKFNFVLLKKIGEPVIVSCDLDDIKGALKHLEELI